MDYQNIIENITEDKIKQILNKLEIPYEDKGGFLIMPTYCHNHRSEEASHKLYYYKNNKIFMCFTECGAMSIFKFLKNYYEAQGYDYDWYNDIYRLITDNHSVDVMITPKYHRLSEKYGTTNKYVELPSYKSDALDCFIKMYPVEWLNDGISKQAMDKYNILFSIGQNKIIIPHYDISGRLIGIRGRALNEWEVENVGKYMPIQIEGTWYKHKLSMNLYGLNFNKENIKKHRICYLYESEKSVLQAESFQMPNCGVAVCGSQFNKYALNILMRACAPAEIVVCFDKEEKEGESKYFNKLWNLCKKYQNYANFSFIYDREHLINMKDSPTDHGEDIFKRLLEKRVIVR